MTKEAEESDSLKLRVAEDVRAAKDHTSYTHLCLRHAIEQGYAAWRLENLREEQTFLKLQNGSSLSTWLVSPSGRTFHQKAVHDRSRAMLLCRIGDKAMAFDIKNLKPASKSLEFNKDAPRAPKAALAQAIDRQIALLKNPKEVGKRWFNVGDKEACLTLRYGAKSIPVLADEHVVVVPRDQLEGALLHFKAEAEKGSFDAVLAGLEERRAARVAKMRRTRADRKAAKAAEPEKKAAA